MCLVTCSVHYPDSVLWYLTKYSDTLINLADQGTPALANYTRIFGLAHCSIS